jgi:hypothetical protein
LSGTILQKVKTLVEVDLDEMIFDDQLLLYINNGLRYLANNKIPVSAVKIGETFDGFTKLRDGDSEIVLAWLHLYVLQRFDMTTMGSNRFTSSATTWIEVEMTNLIHQLKSIYDNEVE